MTAERILIPLALVNLTVLVLDVLFNILSGLRSLVP